MLESWSNVAPKHSTLTTFHDAPRNFPAQVSVDFELNGKEFAFPSSTLASCTHACLARRPNSGSRDRN